MCVKSAQQQKKVKAGHTLKDKFLMPAFEIYLFSKSVFTRASASISVIPHTPLLEESWTLVPRITESRPALCQAPVMVLKQQIPRFYT